MRGCLLVLLLCLFASVAYADDSHFLLQELPRGSATQHRDGYFSISIDEDAAIGAAHPGGSLWVPLPYGIAHLIYRSKVVHPDGTWTFVGTLANVPGTLRAVITFGNGVVFGTIPATQQDTMWSLVTLRGETWLVDSGRASTATPAELPEITHAAHSAPARGKSVPYAASTPGEATADDPATIDLLVGYTPEFVAQFGSLPAARTFIQYQVDKTNQAFNDSQVHGQVRLVKIVRTTIPDSTDSVTALNELPDDAALMSARVRYGADIVAMAQSATGGCRGAYYQLGHDLTPISLVHGDALLVWGDDGTSACDPMPGYGIAAMLGGVFGLDMQPNVPGQLPGAYTFSYAYQKPGTSGPAQGTLEIGGKTVWPYFSNPRIILCDGGPCGVAGVSDAAHSLNLALPIIAAFTATKVMPRNDLNGDHDSDLLWLNAASGTFGKWLMDGRRVVGLSAMAITPGYAIAAAGDFDGDGKTDLVWTNAAATPYPDSYLWTSTGNGFTSAEIEPYSADNKLLGAGVFDVDDEGYGSGNVDLVFLNQQTNTFGWWVMRGSTILRKWSFQVAPGYTVAAMGDFNGDGRTDIIWTSAAHDLYLWTWVSHGFDARYVGTYPAGWQLEGAGDVDGDGSADLIWANPGTGGFGYWLMVGATEKKIWTTAVSKAYHIAALGDFNGDGMTDVMWTSAARDLYLWTSNGSDFDAQYVGTYPSGWSVVPSQVMAAWEGP